MSFPQRVTPHRFGHRFGHRLGHRFGHLLPLALILPIVACEAVLPAVLSAGGSLLATAFGNHRQEYANAVKDLTESLRRRISGDRQDPPSQQSPAKPVATGNPVPPSKLTLELALLRQIDEPGGTIRAAAITDGEPLTYRQDAPDRFKIMFRPSEECFVYVILIDGTGFVQPLFPDPDGSARVSGQAQRFLPEGDLDLAYAVDEHPGVETIYFLASRQRRPDIEQHMAAFAKLERKPLVEPLQVAEPLVVQRGSRLSDRGQAKVRTRSGDATFDTAKFLSESGVDVVVTRWFEHRKE